MFEEDPAGATGSGEVGYLAAVLTDLRSRSWWRSANSIEDVGYESELVVGGRKPAREYLTWTWPDLEAPVAGVPL
jgi:hypothetical protein